MLLGGVGWSGSRIKPVVRRRALFCFDSACPEPTIQGNSMSFITSQNAATVGKPFNSITGSIAGKIGGSRPKPKRIKPYLTDEEKTRQTAINRQLKLVREQLTRTRTRLNQADEQVAWCEHCKRGGMPDHHRAQLLRALDGLLERECDLLAIPGRGRRKPASERPKTCQGPVEPIG